MLFSLNIFMRRTLRRHQFLISTIIILNFVVFISAETQGENTVKFSGDFENFLNDLGSLVYKAKKPAKKEQIVHTTTTPHTHDYRKSEKFRMTQKQAIGDMLMMKLVSYYEDKYKLTHDKDSAQQTTEKITLPIQSFSHHYSNKYNEIERSDMRTAFSNKNNRRYNAPYTQKQYEDPLDDVVVI